MSYCFEGVGQWAATFGADGVEEGTVVKPAKNGGVTACAADEAFCGVAIYVGRDAKACSVQLGGMTTTAFSGTAPTVGRGILAADGNGGVKTATSGEKYWIVAVDTDAGTVTFKL